MARFIDTHNHFFANSWTDGLDAEFGEALREGVWQMLVCAGEVSHFEDVKNLAHHYGCGYAVGLHPLYLRAENGKYKDDLAAVGDFLTKNIQDPNLAAVGEIGLDGSEFSTIPMDVQLDCLRTQLKLARRFNLSVSLHGRGALDSVAKCVREIPAQGVFHAFSGSPEQAQKLMKLGLMLGFGGAMTYSGSKRIRKVLSELPDSGWVLETDAPDMPGEAARNDNPQNPQSRVCEIAGYAVIAAELRGETYAKTVKDAFENSLEAFPRLKALGQMKIVSQPSN